MPPRALRSAVAVVELKLPPDGVGDASLQRPQRFFAGFAVGLLAQVVGAPGCVMAHLGDGDDVDGVIEGSVAAPVQPVPVGGGAGGFDRCRAVVVGELGVVRNRRTSRTWPKMMAAITGPTPCNSVSVVAEAVTASAMRCLTAASSPSSRSISARCSAAIRQRSMSTASNGSMLFTLDGLELRRCAVVRHRR